MCRQPQLDRRTQLAGQTRPDLLASVSLAQQMQQRPSVANIRFSNEASARALKHQDKGIHLYPLDLDTLQVVTFHDAAWANALPFSLAGEDGFSLTPRTTSSASFPMYQNRTKSARPNELPRMRRASMGCWLW